jgi:hypothetical protein
MTTRSKAAPPEFALWQLLRVDAINRSISKLYDENLLAPSRSWAVRESKLSLVARMAATSIVRKSPHFRLPVYGPLGRLDPDGYDRLSALSGRFDAMQTTDLERVRAQADFCALATLLDFDCGPTWRTRTRTGVLLGSDTGTLVIAYRLFVNGALSNARERDPMRVDADALASIDRTALEVAFAAAEGAPPQGLDEALARLRAVVERIAGNDAGERRLGASIVDALIVPVRGAAPTRVTPNALYQQCARALMGAYDDRTRVYADRPMTLADVRYASLTHAIGPLFDKLGLPFSRDSQPLSPPDRWSLSLLLDTAAIAPSNGQTLSTLLADRAAVEELYALGSVSLDATITQVRSLTKTTEQRLTNGAILAWGTAAAGRALSARDRPGGAPVFW